MPFLRWCIFLSVMAYQAISKSVSMDLEWIIQGGNFEHTGFVIELLGIGSALRKYLPRSRVTKSYFRYHLNESPAASDFQQTLFNEEQQILQHLIEKEYFHTPQAPLLFRNMSRYIDESVCAEPPGLEEGMAYIDLARPLVDVKSSSECCLTCVNDPLCIAWSFGCDYNPGCSLQGTFVKTKKDVAAVSNQGNDDCSRSAIQRPGGYERLPVPRALIFHGTSCDYQNQTISSLKRDINTLWIGRFMLERGGETLSASVLGREELQILNCAARMDEVWVPTEWNKRSMIALAQQLNIRLPVIAVIPEAVDTNLFDSVQAAAVDCVSDAEGICSQTEPFQFLSVFKWEHRKGWDVLLEAYWQSFGPTDNVVLRLHTYRPSFLQGQTNITENLEKIARDKFGKEINELASVNIGDSFNKGKH